MVWILSASLDAAVTAATPKDIKVDICDTDDVVGDDDK